MMTAILGNTGYFVGIGVEAFVILICGVMLALMLTGVLFKWMAQGKVTSVAKAAAKAAAAEARAVVEEEAAAQAAAEEEAERAQAEIDAKAKKEAEAAAAEAAAALAEKKAKEDAARAEEEAKNKPKLAPMAKPAKTEEVSSEETTVTSESEKVVVKERVIERTVVQESAPAAAAAAQPAAVAEAAATEADEDPESEFVVVHDGIVFNDSKSITELYEELSPEQQSYFDELREEALTKPDAELAISKNFVSVKIGKRNLIKLLIKRGVTVAEFMLENDALKALRLSNTNKRGKSSIKVKPTVVQVLDLNSLKVAVDMINLSYEELMLGD